MRTLYAGAGLALTTGLLMGAAMRPDLGAFDRPRGPQVISQAPSAGPTGPFDDRLAYAGYAGEIPDYVLGTDWKKLVAAPLDVQASTPDPGYAEDDGGYYESPLANDAAFADVGAYTPAVYRAPVETPVSYPSLDGGAAYEDVSRAEKTPLVVASEVDEDAPPEATGDTTLTN